MAHTITKRYHFESAHFLPYVHDKHKCKRMHGHNYEIEITVSGVLDNVGFIIDFWDLDDIVKPLIETVDHRTLNDVLGLENPTAEYIAAWFADKLLTLPIGKLVSVKVFETKDCWATYTAE